MVVILPLAQVYLIVFVCKSHQLPAVFGGVVAYGGFLDSTKIVITQRPGPQLFQQVVAGGLITRKYRHTIGITALLIDWECKLMYAVLILHSIVILLIRPLGQPCQTFQQRPGLRCAGALPDEFFQHGPNHRRVGLQITGQIRLELFPVVRGKILINLPSGVQPIHQVQHIAHKPLRGVRQLRHRRILCPDQPIQPFQHGFGLHGIHMFDKIIQRVTNTVKISFLHFRHKVGNGLLPGA